MVFKNLFKITVLTMSLSLFISAAILGQNRTDKPLYLDSGQSIEKRVEDLLGRMTLAEKVGQMNMPCVYAHLIKNPLTPRHDILRRTRRC